MGKATDRAVVTGFARTAADLERLVSMLVYTRKEMGLRQIDVARMMGVGQPSVSEFERGETSPKVSTIIRYAEALGGTLSYRVDWPVEETDNGQ